MLAMAIALPDKARAAMQISPFMRCWGCLGGCLGSQPLFRVAGTVGAEKTDPARMGTVLAVTAEILRAVAIMAQPAISRCGGEVSRSRGGAGGSTPVCPCWTRPPHSRRHAAAVASPVFPRYVDRCGGEGLMLIDSHGISIFLIWRRIAMACWRRAGGRCPG